MDGESASAAAPAATDTTAAPNTVDKEQVKAGPTEVASGPAPLPASSDAQPPPSNTNGAPSTAARLAKPKPAKKAKPKAADAAKANSLAGGLIGTPSNDPPLPGWLLAGGGTRKSQPEWVVPFKLPCLTLSDTPPRTASESGNTSQEDAESQSEPETSSDDASDSDESSRTKAKRKQAERERKLAQRALEQTYVQTQSLRQSRLFYLASLLPPYSQRAPRSGQVFPASVPPSALHGIDPAAKGSHVLVPLGRFDVEAGPHVFPKTKLWEMRKEAPPSSPKSSRKSAVKQGSPTPGRSKSASAAKANALPKPSQAATASATDPSSSTTQTPKPKQAAPRKAAAAASSPSASSAKQQPGTPATAAAGFSAGPHVTPPAPQRPLPPPAPTPRPPAPSPPVAAPSTVDPVLVTRVNIRAAHNPGLRELLGVAARGQATPEQLRALGEVIQQVTREMEAEGLTVQPPRPLPQLQPQPPMSRPPAPSPSQATPGQHSPPTPGPAQGGSTSNAKSGDAPAPAPKKPRKSGGSKKKKEAAGTAAETAPGVIADSAEATAKPPVQSSSTSKSAGSASKPDTAGSSKKATASSSKGTFSKNVQVSAPPAPLFRPPILVLEFRENFNTRFYLPLWTSIVTRQKRLQAQSEEECGEEELTEEEPIRPMVEVVEVRLQFLAPLHGSDAVNGVAAETKVPVCLFVAGQDPQGMLWEAAGRVPGIKTLDVHGQVMREEHSNLDEARKGHLTSDKQGVVNPTPSDNEKGPDVDGEDSQKKEEERRQKEEAERREKEQKAREELQKERDVMRAIAEAILARPAPTLVDPSGAFPPRLEEHLADRFAPAGPSTQADAPRGSKAPKRRLNRPEKDAFTIATSNAEDSIDLSMYAMDSDGEHGVSVGMSASASAGGGAGAAMPKPRKKRNVATHNPDGTLKRCNHCQTNTTPMWRRGPDGPGTLCNACGARWKVGRLGAVPPPKAGAGGDGQAKTEPAPAAGQGTQDAPQDGSDAKAQGGGGGGGGDQPKPAHSEGGPSRPKADADAEPAEGARAAAHAGEAGGGEVEMHDAGEAERTE